MQGYKKVSSLLSAVILFGCITPPTFEEKLESYQPITGTLNAIPRLDKQGRLFISITTESGPALFILKPSKDSNIPSEILESIAYHPFEKPIILYGNKLNGPVDEYLQGIDYEAFVIAYYDPPFEKYVFVQVDYTKGAVDSLKEIDTKKVLSLLFEWVKKLI